MVGAHLGQQAEALFGLLARGDVHGVDRDAAVSARIDPALKPARDRCRGVCGGACAVVSEV